MSPALRRHLPSLLSAALAFALYAVSIGGTYVYDDVTIFKADPRLHDPSLWGQFWTQSYNEGVDNLYRPIVSMSYAFEWWLHGDRPWIFHLINVLLHAFVTALVAEFAHRLLNARAAMVAGLLFAAHPLHVEAVANIVGRAELMCALGIIGALLLFTRPMTYLRALAITGCFVLALLSKEQGMLLPLLLLILGIAVHVYPLPSGMQATLQPESLAPMDATRPVLEYARVRAISIPRRNPAMLLLIVMLCWLLSGYIIFRESILKFWWDRGFLDWTINPMVRCAGSDRWLMPLVLLGRYTALLVTPVRLSPDYGAKVIGWTVDHSDPYLYLGIATILVWILVLGWFVWKRSGVGVFATLALAVTYGMIGNIISLIGTNFAERLVYLPSLFFILIVAALFSAKPRMLLTIALSIVLVLVSVRTFTYARRWNDKLDFYRTCLQEQPKSIRLYMLLASEHMDRKQLDEAERVVREGREMLPEYWEIWVQSGVIAMTGEKWDEAEQYFNHAANIRPSVRINAWIEELHRRREKAATRPAQ